MEGSPELGPDYEYSNSNHLKNNNKMSSEVSDP